jgi:hypothetical protein
MIHEDEKSNAQSWELEVACKNKKYMYAVVNAIQKYGMIDFSVENVEITNYDEEIGGRYLIFMNCSGFNNLKNISNDLAKIEKDLEKF